jgi:hypothetical protein
MNTYWTRHPRNFGNEYIVGIATTAEDAAQYEAEGFDRCNRESALHAMSYRGDEATKAFVDVTLNGKPVWDRFEAARDLRKGNIPATI